MLTVCTIVRDQRNKPLYCTLATNTLCTSFRFRNLAAFFALPFLRVLHPCVDNGLELNAEIGTVETFLTYDDRSLVSRILAVPPQSICTDPSDERHHTGISGCTTYLLHHSAGCAQ
jgi:hypothetical protein